MSGRRSLRRIGAAALAAIGWTLTAAPAVQAEQDPNLARGFSPGEVYDFSGIDSINLFNGALNVSLPLGRRYPVGDGLSYGLHLTYSSSTWEPEVVHLPQIRMHPRRSANAGHGWMLSLGGTFYRRPGQGPAATTALEWESPDGSEHLFYGSLHIGESSDCWFTRDNSYLRLCEAGTRTIIDPQGQPEQLERYTIEFPDGRIQTYEEIPTHDRISDFDHERLWLVEIADRLGNWVRVEYERTGPNGLKWTITDSVDRSHTVELSKELVDGKSRWRANRANLQRPGGGTAPWILLYESEMIDRSCKTNPTINDPERFDVSLLSEVVLPAGAGSYEMPAYNTECSAPNWPDAPRADLPGTLTQLELPTGGQLHWIYRDHIFIVPDPQDPVMRILERSTGVGTKRELDASGTCGSQPIDDCTWTYSSSSYSDETRRMRVVDAAGNRTVHWFRQRRWQDNDPLFVGWDYGLPFSAEPEHTHNGLFLSRHVYKGDSNQVLQRQMLVSYEHDPLIPILQAAEDWRNSNRRVVKEGVHFYDDKNNGVPRWKTVSRSDFDGLGHHRVRMVASNLGGPLWHAETTQYNPDQGTFQVDSVTHGGGPDHDFAPWSDDDPWVLDTYASKLLQQESSAPVASQYCFEGSTGRLIRQRMLKGASPGIDDVIVESTRSPVGNPQTGIQTVIHYQERTYGGDLQPVPVPSPGPLENTAWCSLNLPSTPAYRVAHTSEHGTRSKTERLTPGGSSMGLKTLDLVIDPSTGLPSSSFDPAGLRTNFLYDALGRLTWIRPRDGGDAWTKIEYEPRTPTTRARVTVTRFPNLTTGSPVLEESRTVYDAFGRVASERRRIPGHQDWTEVRTLYNAMGWVTEVTERGLVGGPIPHRTRYLNHDAFGRPTQIDLPDQSSDPGHRVFLTYRGERSVKRNVSIATSLNGGETRHTTEELYDALGRLYRVSEPSGPGGGMRDTDYGYDAAGRLVSVAIDDGSYTQFRSFDYDGRGFLLSETHPENGLTRYRAYDARGHAGRKTTGANLGLFDLGFTYDAAERLTEVREWGSGGRLLKSFVYGTGKTAADRSNGKIKTALRNNFIPHPTQPGEVQVEVTEEYTYGGTGGRVSKRVTTLDSGQQFEQTWAYDDLGQVEFLGYPICKHSGAQCSSGIGVRPRTVRFTYDLGYLTGAVGYASPITYHPNGMLAEIHHANGVIYGQELDDHWMRRPGSLYVFHPSLNLSLVEGDPDPPGTPHPYTYDGAGNVKSWSDERYRYDGVSRVLEGKLGGGQTQSYSYDVFGNIRTITTNRTGFPQTVQLAVDVTTNRLSAATYDAAGNLTSRSGFLYSYDPFSMMETMEGGGNDSTYIYTADDERIWSVDATNPSAWKETFTLRDLDGKVLRIFETDSGQNNLAWENDYIYRNGQLLATARKSGGGETRHHFHLNHLGTPILITRPDGSTEAFHSYFPFGEELNDGGDSERMKYTGHERDLNTAGQFDDLDYMHARYCSPLLGRFLSVDPVGGDPWEPQSWNRYAYGTGNPLRFVDPDGRQETPTSPSILDSLKSLFAQVEANQSMVPNTVFIDGEHRRAGLSGEDLLLIAGAAVAVSTFADLFEASARTDSDQIRQQEGDAEEANRQFDATVDPESVEEKGEGLKVGSDRKTGRTIVLRERSTDSGSVVTLEEQRVTEQGRTRSRKIRYYPKEREDHAPE